MSELKTTLLEKHDGQQVGGDILCPHPVTGKMMTAARPDGEGGFTETADWRQAKKDAAADKQHKADVDKLADEALAAEVEKRKSEKAAEAAAAPTPPSEKDVADKADATAEKPAGKPKK